MEEHCVRGAIAKLFREFKMEENKKIIISVDIDNTICENKVGNMTYADVKPFPEAVAALQLLKKEGHTIILITGRHMKTCVGNMGLVWARQGKILLDWLEKYHIPYDEIHLKPHYDICIDDATHHHIDWISSMHAIRERIAKGPRGPENP